MAPQHARLLGPGKAAITGGVDLASSEPTLEPSRPISLPLMQLSLGYRRGLTEDWDVGGRVWGMGVPGFAGVGAAVEGK
ncbi:MAG: hypothetical protein AAGI01_10260, partial [Myxococcota bacterium]